MNRKIASSDSRTSNCKKVCLKTINILIEDEYDDEENDEIWYDLDDTFDGVTGCSANSGCGETSCSSKTFPDFAASTITTTKSLSIPALVSNSVAVNHQDSAISIAPQPPPPPSLTAASISTNWRLTNVSAENGGGNSGTNADFVSLLRPQKRIFWGEEMPSLSSSSSSNDNNHHTISGSVNNNNNNAGGNGSIISSSSTSYSSVIDADCVMTMGVNPLITIGPIGRNNISSSAMTNVTIATTKVDDILIAGNGAAAAAAATSVTVAPLSSSSFQSSSTLSTAASSSSNCNSSSSSRVLELDKLRNYFQLVEPEHGTGGGMMMSTSSNGGGGCGGGEHAQFFLSLLDPSMPRLTNCGHYYRMRYAVYALPRRVTRAMNTANWRKRHVSISSSSTAETTETMAETAASSSSQAAAAVTAVERNNSKSSMMMSGSKLLLHIGEMHLYTILPKENGNKAMNQQQQQQHQSDSIDYSRELLPEWCRMKSDYIHYENISFFLNQTPLTSAECSTLRASESEINQMTMTFRRFLKQLNAISVPIRTSSAIGDDEIRTTATTMNTMTTESAATTSTTSINFGGGLTSSAGPQNFSTFLLEQLKYPKSADRFSNADRICEQFVRNQADMFARYHALFSVGNIGGAGGTAGKSITGGLFSGDNPVGTASGAAGGQQLQLQSQKGTGSAAGGGRLNTCGSLLQLSSGRESGGSGGKDLPLLSEDTFVETLFRLRNQVEPKSFSDEQPFVVV